jgi:hypothetical protein
MMANFSIFPHQSTAVPAGPPLFGPAGKLVPCLLLSFNSWRVGFPHGCWFLLPHWSRLSLSLQVISRLVDAQHCETITTVPSLATAALDSVLCHRPLRLSHWPFLLSHWPLLLHKQPFHPKTSGLYVPIQNACSQCSVDAPTNCGGSKPPATWSTMGPSIASGDVGGSLGGIP